MVRKRVETDSDSDFRREFRPIRRIRARLPLIIRLPPFRAGRDRYPNRPPYLPIPDLPQRLINSPFFVAVILPTIGIREEEGKLLLILLKQAFLPLPGNVCDF